MITLRALRHRNFALFIAGQGWALIGYWIQQLAVSWLVYRLTGSATLLGVLSFAANVPVLVLAPLVGLWSDRFNRHRIMIATQVLEMLQAMVLAALAFSGLIETWHIIALTMFLGVCVAVELPVRHAYLLELVGDKQDLPNAVAMTSLVANCGRLIGPSVAGVLIGWFSEATCFLINAITYVAVLMSFAFIRVKRQPTAASHPPALHGFKEGLAYAWRTVPIRLLLTLLAIIALTAAPYGTLMPAIVHEAFGGDAQTLGFLVGAAGMGAVSGTLLLASRSDVRGLTVHCRSGVHCRVCADRAVVVADAPTFYRADGSDRFLHPADLGFDQHDPADYRRRRQARARDEPVHGGVSRRRAARRTHCRRACRPHRSNPHRAYRRLRVRTGYFIYGAPASAAASAHATDLCAAGYQ